mmetsp:Transcript_7054/g.19911  ORF Transcript_7054/g.19911 Transcript_7054/m.19911 type:complete len:312 (-) Transcript_7054:6325-7260(-)
MRLRLDSWPSSCTSQEGCRLSFFSFSTSSCSSSFSSSFPPSSPSATSSFISMSSVKEAVTSVPWAFSGGVQVAMASKPAGAPPLAPSAPAESCCSSPCGGEVACCTGSTAGCPPAAVSSGSQGPSEASGWLTAGRHSPPEVASIGSGALGRPAGRATPKGRGWTAGAEKGARSKGPDASSAAAKPPSDPLPCPRCAPMLADVGVCSEAAVRRSSACPLGLAAACLGWPTGLQTEAVSACLAAASSGRTFSEAVRAVSGGEAASSSACQPSTGSRAVAGGVCLGPKGGESASEDGCWQPSASSSSSLVRHNC